ncbi:MAG: dihydrodipicolinate synthase family protein [Deltaproteobacteria bacterium]|nr:dihydrodipicolinate synthase family protein [Deltaproteobacteria bacterium]MBW2393805.1 dihydrodipicolinate synthase family protein [Deltaproteobacteria bacterium]
MSELHPSQLVKLGRKVHGMSAVLLPITATREIDWQGFRALLSNTAEAGLTPAVNMDTGYVQLLDDATRHQVLDTAKSVYGEGFAAGAHVRDRAGAPWNPEATSSAMEAIESRGGIPVVFPSNGLTSLDGQDWAGAHAGLAQTSDRFIGFELGSMFVPYGRIYDLDAYAQLMAIPQCIGAKHSSLSRQLEWDRLALRDARRPDFLVLTGNDLAIDMVMYGSDYLLGLSAFSPEHFALRDRLWEAQDPTFYELNDLLQYLGCFAFRDPVPAYKHDAAMFLELRGRIASAHTHPGSPERPGSDRAPLADIARRLEAYL